MPGERRGRRKTTLAAEPAAARGVAEEEDEGEGVGVEAARQVGRGKPTGDECRRCGKMGHWARECPSRPKKEQAHVVQEDEEASLLLVRASPIIPHPPPP
jgi:hypothetical protein